MLTILTVLTQYYQGWGDRRARGMFPTVNELGTYESRVWRLAARTIWMLDAMRAAADCSSSRFSKRRLLATSGIGIDKSGRSD
jgi:hypothetical protein